MSDRTLWRYRVEDILQSIDRIDKTLSGFSYEDYNRNEDAQDIVARHFQIIGEAARKIPEDVRAGHGEIPWKKMIGLRHFVVHEYHRVDQRIIWDTAQTEIPALKAALEQLIEKGS